MDDNAFVKTQDYQKYAWREMKDAYVMNVEMKARKSLELPKTIIEVKVCNEMRTKYQNITSIEGKELVRKSGVLLFLECDLVSTIAFDTVRRHDAPIFNTKEEVTLAL